MATGLDVAAGIAGLITLADVVIDRTARTIRACKNAGKDSQKLLREVQLLLGILNGLKTIAGQLPKGSLHALVSSDVIQDCQKTLTSVRDKLVKANPDENGISTATRILRILRWPITEPETQKIMAELERYKTAFDLSLSLDSLQSITDSRATQATIARGVDDVRKALADITRIHLNEERNSVLKYFGTFDMEEPHGKNTQLRHPGTNLWFVNGPEFTSWLQSRNSKLWMYGIPGAGKTVLAAAAIEETMQYVDPEYGVCYYYCDYKVPDSQRLQKMFACLAGQLGRQNEGCFDELAKVYRPDPDQPPKSTLPSEADLGKLLSRCFAYFDQVAVIVDGVEECFDPSNVAIALANLVSQCPQLRLLVVSRDEQTIRPHFHDFEKLSIAARNEDLRLYVSAEIEERSKRGTLRIKSTALKDDILDRLINGAEGMFRWVACQMDHLSSLPSDAARRKALQQLPPDLYTTYDRILERVCAAGEENCSLVQRVLYWLFAGSLGSEILLEAVSVERDSDSIDPESRPDSEDILLTCSSLVRAGAEQSLELAHFTVKEYLGSQRIKDDARLNRFYCETSGINEYKALTCLRYMAFPQFAMTDAQQSQQYTDLYKENPFYSFAAWRFDSFVMNSTSTEVEDLAVQFFCSMPDNFTTWKYTFISQEYNNTGVTQWDEHMYARAKGIATFAKPQHVAAMLALQKVLIRILSSGYDANERSPMGTPLHCALGGTELLWLIMDRRQRLNWDIEAAVDESLENTVRTLLENGADVNEPFLLENVCDVSEDATCTAACFACRVTNLRITRLLFQEGARLERHTLRGLFQCNFEKDSDKAELLELLASQSVAEEDVGLLEVLRSKFRPAGHAPQPTAKMPDNQRQGLTASDVEQCLRWACENDDLEMLDSLIAVDATKLDQILADPAHGYLHAAAYRGASRVVKRLLDYKVSADAIDSQGATPLHTALYVESCRSGIYKHLDYNLSIEVVQSLIDHGADVNKLDRNQCSCLHGWAANRRPSSDGKCKAVLDLMLSKGMDVTLQDSGGETPLHAAALYNAKDRIEELRAAIEPAKFDGLKMITDKRGAMAVHIASRGGCMDALKLLREYHPKDGQLTEDGRNEVAYAAQGSGWDNFALEFLLQSGVTASVASKDGSTPIHYCVQGLASLHDSHPDDRVKTAVDSFADAISMLETHGCDVSRARDDKTTALHLLCHIVAQTGFHPKAERCKFCRVFCECMDVLLDHLHDLSDEDKDGHTAMQILLKNCFRTYPDSFDISVINLAAVECLYRVLLRCNPEHIVGLKHRGLSALAIASMLHHDRTITRLLELGADVDEKGLFDLPWTPIQLMCRQGCSSKVVEMALKATKSVKQRNVNGDTLLHLATSTRGRKSHEDVLKALIRAGIDVDARSDAYSETALMSSACTGSIDEMEILLAAGADVNVCDETGGTALAKACWGGHLAAVQLLLDSGAKNDFSAKRYFSGDTHLSVFGGAPLLSGPLHLAAEAGNVQLMRLLLENSTSPAEDAKATDKASPLWWASYYGHLDVVRLLLQYGFDPDDTDPIENLTSLHVAVVFSQLSVMHLLLEAGCNDQALDRLQRSPMDHATAIGNQAAIQILASHQARNNLLRPRSAEIPVKPSTPQRPTTAKSQFSPPYIMDIIDKGDLEAVQRLCESGIDFSLPYAECSCTPLLEAMFLGKNSIASYLLDKNVSTKGTTCAKHSVTPYTAGKIASRKPEQLSLLTKLLDGQKDDRSRDMLAHEMLVTAAKEGNMPATKELITRGHLKPMSSNIVYRSHPLFAAIRAEQPGIAMELLSAGVDVTFMDSGLVTALHVASDVDLEDVIIKLLDLGANPNARDDDMRSPLSWAAWADKEEVVDLLIERGANPGFGNTRGPSVISEAIRGGNLELAGRLIAQYRLSSTTIVKSLQYMPIAWSGHLAGRNFALRWGVDLDVDSYLFDVGLPRARRWRRRVIKLLTPEALFANLTYQRPADIYSGRLTPLHHTVVKGDHKGLLLLLKAGALINTESDDLPTPLMVACRYGRFRIARLLIRREALLVYVKGDVLFSAVREAAGYPEIVRWILVGRHTDQQKLEGPSTGSEEFVPVPENLQDSSFAPATSFGSVPWSTQQLVLAEQLDEFVCFKLASFRSGTFYCREDGQTTLIPAGSSHKPWG